MTRRNGPWWRRRVWATASLLMLALYFVGTIHPAKRTPVGTEHYLFGLGDSQPTLLESPRGGSWVLASAGRTLRNPTPTPYAAFDGFVSTVVNFQWPYPWAGPRYLTPFAHPASTYALRDATLTRVWRYQAGGWIDSGYLTDDKQAGSSTSLLDLRSGRTYHGPAAQAILARLEVAAEEDETPWERYEAEEDPSADTSALEGLPPGTRSEGQKVQVGDQSFYLETQTTAGGPPLTVISTDEEVPRTLELASNASPMALSRDGRTLFFARDGALWRLDLIRPLSSLLDDATPTLPEPPEDIPTAAR